jgi:iron complex transport system ATP-binding protein
MSGVPLVEFRNATVFRGERAVLDGINLSIAQGEHVAILGPNGSGKSTLIKTITRECYPLPGPDSSVRILGEELWNIFDLRVLLGIVTTDILKSCNWELLGEELVLSGFFSSLGVWPNHHVTDSMKAKAREVLGLLGAGHLAARSVHEMSSGEVQRMLVARALVHDPKGLVLDEPTNSLDVRARGEFNAALERLAAAGTSIIMVTHNLGDILPVIGRVVLVSRGHVFRDGPKKELLTAPLLSEVFESPVEVARRDGYFHIW